MTIGKAIQQAANKAHEQRLDALEQELKEAKTLLATARNRAP